MKNKTNLFVFALFTLIVIGMLWHIKALQLQLAQENSLKTANFIATATVESHKLYAENITTNQTLGATKTNITTLPENLSLNLVKRIGKTLATNAKVRFYSPYPFSEIEETNNWDVSFSNEAWSQMTTNNKNNYFKVYENKSNHVIGYALPVRMEATCIGCHNNLKESPKKDWKLNDLAGQVEVRLPFKKLLPKQNEVLRTTVILYSSLTLCGIIGIILMIVKQKHYNDELTRLTAADPLTGLYNLNELRTTLKRETEKVKRGGESLCLMYFDIDGFKQINDTLGHFKGDELLKSIGNMLPDLIRPFDVPCRYSADEFAIILPGCTPEAATHIGERIVEKLHLNYPEVKLSIGISQSAMNNFREPEELIKQAKINKDAAKEKNDNKIKS